MENGGECLHQHQITYCEYHTLDNHMKRRCQISTTNMIKGLNLIYNDWNALDTWRGRVGRWHVVEKAMTDQHARPR